MSYLVNKIFILESIPDDEVQTGEELFNDTISRYIKFYKSEIESSFVKINSKDEFINELNNIFSSVEHPDKIILHIEAHGNKNEMSFKNGDKMSWQDLIDCITPINQKLKNGIHLFVLTCFGRYIGLDIDTKKTVPFKSFLTAREKIYPNEIIGYYTSLYEKIIETGDLYKAANDNEIMNVHNKFHIKDVEYFYVMYFNSLLNLTQFKTASNGLKKDLLDSMLNINIDLDIMNKVKDPNLYILKLFLNRFGYRKK